MGEVVLSFTTMISVAFRQTRWVAKEEMAVGHGYQMDEDGETNLAFGLEVV